MVALSRLKATFEACKNNFRGLSWTFCPKYENHGVATCDGVACGNRAAVWGAPSHFQTSDVHATVQSSKSNMGLRKNARARTHFSEACPAHAGNLVLKREETSFFGKLRWLEHRHMDRPGRFTGFSTTSSTLTLWILSEHSKPQPAWCSLLLNPTPASVHWPQQLRTFPFLNEDIIMDGLCQELPAYGIACSCGRCFIQSWQHGRSGCQESRVG